MSVELWVALDVSDSDAAISIVKKLKNHVDVFKVGLELYTAEGPNIVKKIKKLGARVFLDLKFHDIPNTVAGAVRNVTRLEVDFLDVHASGGPEMMYAAHEAAQEEAMRCGLESRPKILAITALTSITNETLKALQITTSTEVLVESWARLAKECGMDGVVNSLHEVKAVRAACGEDFLSVTPGIRSDSKRGKDDQRRIGTPKEAVLLGASAIVVGRPILKAEDPVAAAMAIKEEIVLAKKYVSN